MDKIKYFLVLEKRLGDYNLIDINKLDICNNLVNNDIASIDMFTCRYTENEIKEAIIRSNIIHSDYINGTLKIISDMKHNLRVLTKDMYEVIREFQNDDIELDRNYKNKLFGVYKKIVETAFHEESFIQRMLERFKEALKNNDKQEIFRIIGELPYNKGRMLYMCVYDETIKRKQENLRKLEKLDDVA